MVCITAVQSTH